MKCPKCHSDNSDSSVFCGRCAAPLEGDGQTLPSLTKTLSTPLPVIAEENLVAGKYRVLEEIGQGGMGVVYKAEDVKLKRSVALKFLPPHLMHSAELKERFLIEAQAAAALSHPNICVIHEVGESEGRSFIVMEYVEGETLRDKIKRVPLEVDAAVDIASQVAAGLGEAHRKGIIHRDVKSANIMVTDKGQAKVMDFGLAKLRGGSSLTRSQTTLGTVAYMSPEQARGDELDGRTDLWSLGVVLYEMLTGELPFKGDHDQAVIHSILHREPKPLSKTRAGLPSGLEEIVLQALAKSPAKRYQTMEDLREDLEAVGEGLRPVKARPGKGKILGIRKIYVYAGLGLLAVLFGFNVGGLRDRLFGRGGAAPARAIRLAVLPFVNLSGSPEQEYLSDGLTQEMIAQLGRLHPETLSVIARTSCMLYKGSKKPIDQIGRELGVDYVLEGSAQREAGRVRISAELIRVRGQSQLWADSIEREMSGVLALQSDVAKKVAGALALKLLPAEQARLANVRAVNPEAYDACLKGRQYNIKLTKPDLDTAESYYNLALKKDPNYAEAYAGISSVWACRQQMGITLPSEAGPKAKAAAKKAIDLDDTSAFAHRQMFSILTWTDWNWAEAEREMKRADERDPTDGGAWAGSSHFLMIMHRPEEAMKQIEKALQIDPLSISVQSFYAIDIYILRRYDESIAQARKALNMQPNAPVAMAALYNSLFMLGRYDEALALDKANYADDPESVEAFEQGFKDGGYPGSQKRWVELMAARYEKKLVSPINAATGYTFAGEKDLALKWLEKSFEERDPNMPYLSCDPMYDSLRADPRFQSILRRMGLPAEIEKKQ